MQALIYTQPNHIELQQYAYPNLQKDEVIIKIDAVGICGSDMHAFHGKDPRRLPGLVLGHEFAGVVAESASTLYAVGDRVTGNPSIACGVCKNCISGYDNLCSDRSMVGMNRAGAYAEYMSIPAKTLVRIPDDMPLEVAALTEPAATVIHAINLSLKALNRPLPEKKVLVIGAGAIGLMSALLLKSYGCRDLSVVETNTLRLQSVKKNVGCTVFNPLDSTGQQPPENNFDLVIDAVGAKRTRELAFKSVSAAGVIMHIGLQDWASEIDMRKLTLNEITLLGAYIYTQNDLHAAVAALHAGAFGDLSWSESRSLAEGAQAFIDLDRGQTAAAKIILRPRHTS